MLFILSAPIIRMKIVRPVKGIEPIIAKAKKDKEVVALAVFGSFARKEKHRDIDICIFLGGKMTNLEMSRKRLAYLKGAHEKFDVQIFQQLPIYIRHRVLKEGKIMFCSDENALYGIASAAVKEYEDFLPIYTNHLEATKRG